MRIKEAGIVLLLIFSTLSSAFAAQDQQIAQKLAALEKLPPKFSFAVIGDNRSGDDIYRKLLSSAMERKPAFVVNTGDMISTPGKLDEWAKFRELSKDVTVPYFLTIGNHDVHPMVTGSERVYKEQVDLPENKLYYSFVAGNSLFIVLDSSLDDQEKKITGEQLAWLEQVLGSSKEKLKFVFVHLPLYPEAGKGKHHGNSLDRYKDERDRLHALFRKHGVTMVFSGHEHLYLRKSVDGIPYIITGGGGAPLYAKEEDGGFFHYIWVAVDSDKVTGEVVDLSGKVRDRF